MDNLYTKKLREHYESNFNIKGNKLKWQLDPHKKLDKFFYVLELPPNSKHDMWTYCTVGMSPGIDADVKIELFIYSPKQDFTIVELLTVIASYHKTDQPLNLHHTFNIGRPWLDRSKCDYGFISQAYLDGEELELFPFNGTNTNCYWIIPITEAEQEFKIENGCEALENLFEENSLDYLNPERASLV